MKELMKWSVALVVVSAAWMFLGEQTANAARWRGYVPRRGYHVSVAGVDVQAGRRTNVRVGGLVDVQAGPRTTVRVGQGINVQAGRWYRGYWRR